jgi:hypothetical protein
VNRRLFAAAVLLLAGLSAHAGEAQPEGKTYAPGPFDSLAFDGSANVLFRQGERDEVFVEGDAEVQKAVAVELRGSTVVVRSEGGWRFWSSRQRAKLRVTMRELRSLQVSGAADVVAEGPVELKTLNVSISGSAVVRFERLRAQVLRFVVSGSGDGHFGGSVDELSVAISGRSDFFGEALHVRNARIAVSGVGKARVWATGELVAGISGIGTVDYWGRPNVTRRSSGIGNFNDMGPKPAPVGSP